MRALVWMALAATCVGCKQHGGNPLVSEAHAAPATQTASTAGAESAKTLAPKDTPAATRAGQKAPSVPAPRAIAPRTDRTTSSVLAVKNLNASIKAITKMPAAARKRVDVMARLVGTRMLRSQFVGIAGDLQRADAETHALVQANPGSAKALMLRAKALSAIHRFADALVAVEEAAKLGAKPADVARAKASYGAALGHKDALARQLQLAQAAVAKRGSYTSYTSLGTALMQHGKYAEADAAYQKAQDAYTDLSPFARAWVDFQRGVMWAERADQPEKARPFYEAAVRRLPEYHTAVVHLVEMLVEKGDTKRAIALLRPVVAVAEDPEAAGTLGELLVATGNKKEGEALIAKARGMYDVLLKQMPLAYSDHGAEFFMANGDLKRAATLADANLANRKTARAYDLAIRVHAEAKNPARACALAQEAVKTVTVHPVLRGTLTDVEKSGCSGLSTGKQLQPLSFLVPQEFPDMRYLMAAAAFTLLLSGPAFAADHLDAPAVTADPTTDINDLYAWTSSDGTKINFIMTVHPIADGASTFSDAAQYVFHTTSWDAYGGTAGANVDIICQFDASQNIECWLGSMDYASGDASGSLTSQNSMFTVHTGLHDDPFFMNLAGFNATVEAVNTTAAGLGAGDFDAAGCVTAVDASLSGTLVSLLQDPPATGDHDFFAPLNTLAIVIEVDKAALTGAGDIVSVWGATRQQP